MKKRIIIEKVSNGYALWVQEWATSSPTHIAKDENEVMSIVGEWLEEGAPLVLDEDEAASATVVPAVDLGGGQ